MNQKRLASAEACNAPVTHIRNARQWMFFAKRRKYFKLSEDNQVTEFIANQKHHSGDGKLYVDWYGGEEFLNKTFAEAYKTDLNLKQLTDLNGDELVGFGNCQGTVHGGERQTTAKGFLKNQTNLNIIYNANVKKILIGNNIATGVNFTLNGKNLTARATKEIVVSAGTYSSVEILQASSIGPQKDLPVGKNLQDHVTVLLFFEFHRSSPTTASPNDKMNGIYEYLTTRGGPLSTIGTSQFVAFVNTNKTSDQRYPDIG